MKNKIMIGMIILVLLGIFTVKGQVKETPQEQAFIPLNNQNILCYRQDANTCVDYIGTHYEDCTSNTEIRHWWCHENYCINKVNSCQGGGTNVCEQGIPAKCIFRS